MTFAEATSGKPGQRVLAIKVFQKVRRTIPCSSIWVGEIRYFIAMGFAGFNSPANNRRGYESTKGALAASLRYERKGKAKATYEFIRA